MDSFQNEHMLSQNSSNNAAKKQSSNQSKNNAVKKQSTKNSSSNAKKKQSNNKSSGNAKEKQSTNSSSNLHCLNGNNLELIVAVLLLTGKLRVDAVQLFRQATMIVSLTGKYITLGDLSNNNVDNMLKLLNDNGNMTVDEMIQGLKNKMDS
ncbi:hypothetical protein AN963_21285 [Brevibacillus choshinensis]|uniref:Spore coat protein n=1 Tax=Brevibacillus choshinensis TaxID=54911 RepID=A0ABR5N0F2_BRECH|nr:hypothetical protein [Brevibacillus choshinensis]KQL43982.1 hypothetical protein AN963_21285 [Brevibacillus choshinensis]